MGPSLLVMVEVAGQIAQLPFLVGTLPRQGASPTNYLQLDEPPPHFVAALAVPQHQKELQEVVEAAMAVVLFLVAGVVSVVAEVAGV
jgi:hypothetical protein